jgi:uncharacterized protein (TIGR02145 family)
MFMTKTKKSIQSALIHFTLLTLVFFGGCEESSEDHSKELQANFEANKTVIKSCGVVKFHDNSNGEVKQWEWNYGNDHTDTKQNPSHTFFKVGSHTVSLTVSNAFDKDTEEKTNYITVEVNKGTFIDKRDGQEYEWIEIGNQIWMAENLNYDQNAYGKDWSYNNNSSNAEKYGRLYSWEAVMQGEGSNNENPGGVQGVCPEGWHVPSDKEWKELEVQLGMNASEAKLLGWRGTDEGSKMAGNASLWKEGELTKNSYFNASRFKALPGGYYSSDSTGNFEYIGTDGLWWSSTEKAADSVSTDACFRAIFYNTGEAESRSYLNHGPVFRGYASKEDGYSVRCVKDE